MRAFHWRRRSDGAPDDGGGKRGWLSVISISLAELIETMFRRGMVDSSWMKGERCDGDLQWLEDRSWWQISPRYCGRLWGWRQVKITRQHRLWVALERWCSRSFVWDIKRDMRKARNAMMASKNYVQSFARNLIGRECGVKGNYFCQWIHSVLKSQLLTLGLFLADVRCSRTKFRWHEEILSGWHSISLWQLTGMVSFRFWVRYGSSRNRDFLKILQIPVLVVNQKFDNCWFLHSQIIFIKSQSSLDVLHLFL